ncbi:MAG: Lrp/AsnC ligand binding domain-containing protein [Thermoplasmata archaeon]
MAELYGNSVLFLKIRPGALEEATRELRGSTEVKDVQKLLGPWDLVVSGSFSEYESLRKFAERIDSKPYCERCTTYPNFREWTREAPPETPTTGWAMISTSNVDQLFDDLQRAEEVHWLMSTSGEYNVIAKIGTDKLNELANFLITRVHKVPGVKGTETLPSAE